MLGLQLAERRMYMHYRIRVKDHLDTSWQLSFASLELTREPEGTTLLAGDLPDQSSLFQVLLKLHQLGINLLSLECRDTEWSMNQDVTTYIQNITQTWQAEVCTRLREMLFQAVPDIQERLQYGKPHYLKDGTYLCVVGAAKTWVSCTIFNAATLEAPEGLFEPGGAERRTVKIRHGDAVNYDVLAAVIQQAARSSSSPV
jgi:hypothetical protein